MGGLFKVKPKFSYGLLFAFAFEFAVFDVVGLTVFETAFAALFAAFAAVLAAFASVFAAFAIVLAAVFTEVVLAVLARLAFAFEAVLVLAASPQAIPRAPRAKRLESAIIFLM